MTAHEVALSHYQERQRLVLATARDGARLWRQVDPAELQSWAELLARLLVVLVGAQRAAARPADTYAGAVLAEQGIAAPAAGSVSPSSLSGTASDGRSLEDLLWSPVVAAKMAIARGSGIQRAMAAGEATLTMALRTQVADAGRVADGVAIAVRPAVGYVRMIVGDSCPRCAILAGRVYRWSDGFERHPQCNCIHIPAQEDAPGDFRTDPQEAFRQGRIVGLSKADTAAIDDGADLAQVVNAHQGMSTAGDRKTTSTGTTRRGLAGQRLRGRVRLMPEQIYRDATSREEAVQLLRQHGYII